MKSKRVVSLKNISYSYSNELRSVKSYFSRSRKKEITCFSDVDLEILEGERLALIGPNGVGKTTLMMVVNGLYKPQEGSVFSDGIIRTLYSDFEPLWKEITVIDFVKSYIALLNGDKTTKEQKQIVTEVINFCRLNDEIYKKFTKLSFGQRNLIIVATYTATPCQLLIMDESLVGIDESHIKSLSNRVNCCLGHRGAMLMISHRKELLSSFCHYGLVMNKHGQLSDKLNINSALDIYSKESSQSDTQY